MDEHACQAISDDLLRCWKINGAMSVDEDHACYEFEEAYKKCVKKYVTRGMIRNKDFGGQSVYKYMWHFMSPLRANDNTHTSYANKQQSCNQRTAKNHVWWQQSKGTKRRKF